MFSKSRSCREHIACLVVDTIQRWIFENVHQTGPSWFPIGSGTPTYFWRHVLMTRIYYVFRLGKQALTACLCGDARVTINQDKDCWRFWSEVELNNNNKSGFKEPSSNQKPLKTLYNDGKKKEKKSEKNINVKMTWKHLIYTRSRITHTHTRTHTRTQWLLHYFHLSWPTVAVGLMLIVFIHSFGA